MDSALTPSDDDLDQPEVDALLTLSDFDLDRSKHEDIRLLESKPVTVFVLYREPTLQDPAGPLSGMTIPSCLSTAAADAPESPRQHQCLETSTINLDSKLSSLRQERLCKSSRDAILSQKDRPIGSRINPYRKRVRCILNSLVTGTDIKKSATNTNAKEESLFGNEGNHVNLLPESKPAAFSVASCSHMSSHDHPRSQPFDSDTSGDALPYAWMPSRVQGGSSTAQSPTLMTSLATELSQEDVFKETKENYGAGHLHGEEAQLKRHKSLQMEGQTLLNQSSVARTEVGKRSASNKTPRRLYPQD